MIITLWLAVIVTFQDTPKAALEAVSDKPVYTALTAASFCDKGCFEVGRQLEGQPAREFYSHFIEAEQYPTAKQSLKGYDAV